MDSRANPEPVAELDVADATSPSFVFALGEVDFRFPTLGLEKEVAQVMGRTGPAGVSDHKAVLEVVARPENRYLARGLCWVLTIQGLETYILVPQDPADYTLLIEAVREPDYEQEDAERQAREPGRRPAHVDVVVGVTSGLAPPSMCNGLAVPVVVFDQLYSFDRATLIRSIPTPGSMTHAEEARFRDTAGGFFDHIMHMADNAGATDEHRALNYLAVRYPRIYATVTAEQDRNASLAGIEARPSTLSGVRRIVDVIFSFTHRETDVTGKYMARVDVEDEHPFLMTPLSPYYDLP
jgi:PatG C-terminal